MKKNIFLLLCTFSTIVAQSELSKTVNANPGELNSIITDFEKYNVTNLKITGNIDARDIFFISDSINNISTLDISECTIQNYFDSETSILYSKNELPDFSFGNSNIENIQLPKYLDFLGNWTFYNCKNIRSLIIPDNVSKIGDGVFCESGIENINLSNNINSIGICAFSNCVNLKNIEIPKSIDTISDWCFSDCINLSNINITNSISSIGYGSFYNCDNIKKISIPNSVNSIGDWCFFNCNRIDSILVDLVEPFELDSNVFFNVNKNCILIVPLKNKQLYQNSSIWNDFYIVENVVDNIYRVNININININQNPISNEIFIYEELKSGSLIITDILGRNIIIDDINSNYIDVSFLPSGIYFLKILSKNKLYKNNNN